MPQPATNSEQVPVSTLNLYAFNPRRGNVELIKDSLAELGQFRAIVANRGSLTGRPNEVLAGNHTLQAAQALGWETIATQWVDVDEGVARKIVLVDNRSSDVSSYDDAALLDLLGELEGDLTGTGYTDEELRALMEASLPAPDSADLLGDSQDAPVGNEYGVIVVCSTEAQQAEVYDRLLAEGYSLRVVTV